MITFVINFIGFILIFLIIWWFVIFKPKAAQIMGDTIDIKVHDGVYTPSVVKAARGQTLHLRFIREDDTPCSEIVVFEQLNISAQLPLGKAYNLEVKVEDIGEYDFTCQMGMYRGKLIIE